MNQNVRTAFILALALIIGSVFSFCDDLKSLPQKAIEKSKLTSPGSAPFYLKAKIFESTNPENEEYNAEIEEWWTAPDRWKRVIRGRDFTQTLLVNGTQKSESTTGSYYPIWLHTFVDAIFDPASHLEGIDLTTSHDNPVSGTSQTCRRFSARVGIPPVSNRVFYWYCFRDGLLDTIGEPGFHAEFKNYKKFGDAKIARQIDQYIEPGTTATAEIIELRQTTHDPGLFRIATPTQTLRSVHVSEESLRKLMAGSQQIDWPAIRDGKQQGVLSVYVGIDRDGKVQEIYDLNSDNPHMSDAARKQVKKWTFTPAKSDGQPVQLEGILTFAFDLTQR